ncbi:MAG: iron ABC transporter permease [Prevotellaceae bacterium]|jgi:iron complex transport system permease protein|nr:iron ABC transporter permease [Prevotellaceae bacterium]
MTNNRTRTKFYFGALSLAVILLFVLDIVLGSVYISIREIFNVFFSADKVEPHISNIIINFRLPRACVALLAGVALSVSGLQMQTVFRNPLADPYILGVSSGANLGVALFLLGSSIFSIILPTLVSNFCIASAAFAGSALTLFLVLIVSIRIRDIMTVLIFGIMFSGAATAIVGLLQYMSSESALKTFVVWTLGNLGNATFDEIKIMFVITLTGLTIVIFSIKKLNVLLLGDVYAQTVGVNLRLTRTIIFMSTSLLTGQVVAFCGPIGFIGIAVPHIARMFFRRADHRILVPACILLGANIMLFCDIVSQIPGYNIVIPINIVVAFVGIPVIIRIIFSNKKIINE